MNEKMFQIKMADRIIEVHPVSDQLEIFCKAYLISKSDGLPPDFSVTLTKEDIWKEREMEEKEKRGSFTDVYLERLSLARKIANGLLPFDTLLFHGSCLSLDGWAYLFTAKSGVGKSTHTRLWRKRFGKRVVMINDDKPFVAITKEGVIAYGSPFDGGHHLSTNTSAPLKAICFLTRDTDNHIEPIQAEEAYPYLFEQVYRPKEKGALQRLFPLIDRVSKQTALFTMGCNLDLKAADVAYLGMRKE